MLRHYFPRKYRHLQTIIITLYHKILRENGNDYKAQAIITPYMIQNQQNLAQFNSNI